MNMEELQAFFDTQIKGQQYTYCVIGNKDMVDLEVLKKLGPVKTLGLEELFGYKADAPMELSMNKK
jgi:hypothetical protein